MVFRSPTEGVEVLGVARVGDPDGFASAEDMAKPERLGSEKGAALLFGSVVEDEHLLLHGVVAGGDGDGLAVAGLDELELALVEGLANGVVDEAFGERLLQGGNDGGEGLRHGGRDLGVELVTAAVFEANVTVDDEGVGTRGGTVEGPGEAAEAERKAVQREMEVGARVAQTMRGLAEVNGESGCELGVGGVEGLAELEKLLACGVRSESGKRDDGARGGNAGEVDARLGGGEVQTCVVGGGFERWGWCVSGCAHGVSFVHNVAGSILAVMLTHIRESGPGAPKSCG